MIVLHADRIQLTTDFNELMARYSTVICTLQIFEMNERTGEKEKEIEDVCIYMCHSNINKRKREREKEKKERRC